jgi:hypothetical protein
VHPGFFQRPSRGAGGVLRAVGADDDLPHRASVLLAIHRLRASGVAQST